MSAEAVADVLEMAAFAAKRGWVPATSGNFSRRVDAAHIAITRSGADKARLSPEDVLIIDIDQNVPATASAETPLHAARYRHRDDIQAIMHVHSVTSTVLSRRFAAHRAIELAGYEMQKALPQRTTHDSTFKIPIFSNSQDTRALAEEVEQALHEETVPGYLIAGHGLYAWGESVPAACRHVEALDFLLACLMEEWRRG